VTGPMGQMGLVHEAEVRPKERRTRAKPHEVYAVEVEVLCSCGAHDFYRVNACKHATCKGRTHVREMFRHASGGGCCPALVAVLRSLDDTMTRDEAEGIVRGGSLV
jgi:hypothetical protein